MSDFLYVCSVVVLRSDSTNNTSMSIFIRTMRKFLMLADIFHSYNFKNLIIFGTLKDTDLMLPPCSVFFDIKFSSQPQYFHSYLAEYSYSKNVFQFVRSTRLHICKITQLCTSFCALCNQLPALSVRYVTFVCQMDFLVLNLHH